MERRRLLFVVLKRSMLGRPRILSFVTNETESLVFAQCASERDIINQDFHKFMRAFCRVDMN